MPRPNGLFNDMPPGMPASGSTAVNPPATQAHVTMAHSHGTQMTYFTRVRQARPRRLAHGGGRKPPASPPAAHSHPQHAAAQHDGRQELHGRTRACWPPPTPESAPFDDEHRREVEDGRWGTAENVASSAMQPRVLPKLAPLPCRACALRLPCSASRRVDLRSPRSWRPVPCQAAALRPCLPGRPCDAASCLRRCPKCTAGRGRLASRPLTARTSATKPLERTCPCARAARRRWTARPWPAWRPCRARRRSCRGRARAASSGDRCPSSSMHSLHVRRWRRAGVRALGSPMASMWGDRYRKWNSVAAPSRARRRCERPLDSKGLLAVVLVLAVVGRDPGAGVAVQLRARAPPMSPNRL